MYSIAATDITTIHLQRAVLDVKVPPVSGH
jgi:hypothetical protein